MGRNAGDILTNGLKFRNHLKKRLVLAFSEHFSREVFCGTKTQYMLGTSYMTTILGWQTWFFIILAPFNDSTTVCVDEYSTQICLTLEVVENYELCGFLQARNIQTFWSSPCTKRSGFPTTQGRREVLRSSWIKFHLLVLCETVEPVFCIHLCWIICWCRFVCVNCPITAPTHGFSEWNGLGEPESVVLVDDLGAGRVGGLERGSGLCLT